MVSAIRSEGSWSYIKILTVAFASPDAGSRPAISIDLRSDELVLVEQDLAVNGLYARQAGGGLPTDWTQIEIVVDLEGMEARLVRDGNAVAKLKLTLAFGAPRELMVGAIFAQTGAGTATLRFDDVGFLVE